MSGYRIFYVSKIECEPGYFGPKDRKAREKCIRFVEIDSPKETWDNIRYLIERAFGIHSKQKQKKGGGNQCFSFVEGRLYDATQENKETLKSLDWVDSGACVIVQRKPSLTPPWVPPKYRLSDRFFGGDEGGTASAASTVKFTADMTEDEKINHLCQASSSIKSIKNHKNVKGPFNHASEAPPPDFVCFRCGQKGHHWKNQCPTLGDPTFKPLSSIPFCTGIPRCRLKTVETDQERSRAMLHPDGTLVCLKNEFIL